MEYKNASITHVTLSFVDSCICSVRYIYMQNVKICVKDTSAVVRHGTFERKFKFACEINAKIVLLAYEQKLISRHGLERLGPTAYTNL